MNTSLQNRPSAPSPLEPSTPSNDSRRIGTGAIIAIVVLVPALLVAAYALVALLLFGRAEQVTTESSNPVVVAEPAEEVDVTSTGEPLLEGNPDSATTDEDSTTVLPDGTPVETPEVQATPPPSVPLISDFALSLRGMGPIEFGMTVPQAEALLGAKFDFAIGGVTECDFGKVSNDPFSPWVMVVSDNGDIQEGTIVGITLGERNLTRSGIGIGATKDQVLAAYGDRIQVTAHPYDSSSGSEYLTFVPSDAIDADYRLIFETNDNVVFGVRSGTVLFVEWMEGCA